MTYLGTFSNTNFNFQGKFFLQLQWSLKVFEHTFQFSPKENLLLSDMHNKKYKSIKILESPTLSTWTNIYHFLDFKRSLAGTNLGPKKNHYSTMSFDCVYILQPLNSL